MTIHNSFRKIDIWEEVEVVEDIYDLEDARIDVFIGKDYGYLENPYIYHSNADGVAYSYGNRYAIWIRDGLSSTRFMSVLFHEYAHVYFYVHNMRSSNTEANVEYTAYVKMRENGYEWEAFCMLHQHT